MTDSNNSHDRATHHYNLGIRYERDGDMENALREFNNSLKEDPTFPYPYKSLGEMAYREGRLEEAKERLGRALELDPDWLEAMGLLADVYFDLGDPDNAAPYMETALRGEPANLHYLSQLGRIFIAQKRYTEAIDLLESALRQDPENYKFHYSLGVAFGKRATGDLDMSISHWQEAARLKPDSAATFRNLGIACFTRGLMDDATTAFRKTLDLDPDDPVALRFIQFAEGA